MSVYPRKLKDFHSFHKMLSLSVLRNTKMPSSFRFLYSNASDHTIKRVRLLKRLASTILFGGTFLAVVWAKRRKLDPFKEAKLVPLNSNYHKNFKLYNYKGFIMPLFVMKNLSSVQNFQCREDDIFVVSFPKTGTTWLQEIVYSIMKGIEKSETSIEDRFPYLEFIYPGLSSIEKITAQRFLKTHLPYSLLPESVHQKKPRIIYMMRNPKDVAVSYYHFVRMMTMTDYVGDFSNFFQDFLNDEVPYGPIWKHYTDVWEHKDEPNVLILHYEDFHKDIQGSIKKIGLFLGKHLTDKEVEEIAYHCSFSSMSNNPSVNYQHWDDLGIRKKDEAKFFRKGQVGDWKNYFNSDMDDLMNTYIENHFKSTNIMFCFDLNV